VNENQREYSINGVLEGESRRRINEVQKVYCNCWNICSYTHFRVS